MDTICKAVDASLKCISLLSSFAANGREAGCEAVSPAPFGRTKPRKVSAVARLKFDMDPIDVAAPVPEVPRQRPDSVSRRELRPRRKFPPSWINLPTSRSKRLPKRGCVVCSSNKPGNDVAASPLPSHFAAASVKLFHCARVGADVAVKSTFLAVIGLRVHRQGCSIEGVSRWRCSTGCGHDNGLRVAPRWQATSRG